MINVIKDFIGEVLGAGLNTAGNRAKSDIKTWAQAKQEELERLMQEHERLRK